MTQMFTADIRTGHLAVFVSAILSFLAMSIPARALTPIAPPQLYLDQGWEQLLEAKGDLNGDGIEDRAVIMEAPEDITEPDNACSKENEFSDAPVRRLVISFAAADGNDQLAADNEFVVLRGDQGGVFGNPLEDLRIENGAVVIHHYGGSRWRWGQVLRFRYQKDDWHLIGLTDWWHDTGFGSSVEYDLNTQTGRLKRTVDFGDSEERMAERGEPVCTACRTGENCPERNGCYAGTKVAREGSKWFDIGRKPPILLSNFHCWQEDPGILKHLGFQDIR